MLGFWPNGRLHWLPALAACVHSTSACPCIALRASALCIGCCRSCFTKAAAATQSSSSTCCSQPRWCTSPSPLPSLASGCGSSTGQGVVSLIVVLRNCNCQVHVALLRGHLCCNGQASTGYNECAWQCERNCPAVVAVGLCGCMPGHVKYHSIHKLRVAVCHIHTCF